MSYSVDLLSSGYDNFGLKVSIDRRLEGDCAGIRLIADADRVELSQKQS